MMSENRSTSKQNCDPGWNDPPKLELYSNYMNSNAATNSPPKPKLNLNKRIAFPLNSTNCSNDEFKLNQKIEKSAGGLPMPFAKMKINPKADIIIPDDALKLSEADGKTNKLLPPPPPSSSSSSSSKSASATQQIAITTEPIITTPMTTTTFYDYTMKIFDKCCHSIKSDILLNNSSNKNNNENTQIDEIEKRLTNMKSIWLNDDLDQKIQYILWQIAKALDNENPNEAMHLQRSLIEYTNVCSQFLPALRQLIILMTPAAAAPQTADDEIQSDIVDTDRLIYTNTIATTTTTTTINTNQDNDILSNVLPNETTVVENLVEEDLDKANNDKQL